MKKIIVLLLCLVLGGFCLTGCTKTDEAFTQKDYTSHDEKITGICIDVRDRQIEVMPSPDEQVHINYFENSKEYYDISVLDSHMLTMTAANDKEWTDYIGEKVAINSRKILLKLPNRLLTTLKLSTTNEEISLLPLSIIGDISLSSQGGNIVFDKLNVENSINLNAKNGDISGTISGGYDDYAITCEIKKGESNLPLSKKNGAKSLIVLNNNGNIDIEFS